MDAVWGREDPVKAAVLALFSGDPLLGSSGKLPFLAGCVPPRLPHLATRDMPSFCAKVLPASCLISMMYVLTHKCA